MSDYDYDAAMDQLAEWDEEFRMEEWECKEREREEREEREWEEKHAEIYSLYKDSWVTNENTDPVQSPELVVLGGLRPLCEGYASQKPFDQTSHIEDENSDDRRSGEFRRDAKNVVEASDLEIGKYTEQQSTDSILQKIEQDTEQQIQQKSSICAETCITIMKHGADVFKQQTGRNMTYSEMRNAFG